MAMQVRVLVQMVVLSITEIFAIRVDRAATFFAVTTALDPITLNVLV